MQKEVTNQGDCIVSVEDTTPDCQVLTQMVQIETKTRLYWKFETGFL
jgi:hypothetical protein